MQTNYCSERLELKSRVKQLAMNSARDELSQVASRAPSIGQNHPLQLLESDLEIGAFSLTASTLINTTRR